MSSTDSHSIHRYPGIQPFTREYAPVFFGREDDIEGLSTYIKVNPLVVLYGKSGLGKSSLLNAGLIPRMESRENYSSLFIRFGAYHSRQSVSLKEAFVQKIKEQLPAENTSPFLAQLEIPDIDVSIWQYLKALAWHHKKYGGSLVVLDQFEEVFSYPTEEVRQFGKALSEVVNDRMPDSFRQKLYEKVEKAETFVVENSAYLDFLDQASNLKVLIGIRSDRLSLLDRFSPYLPNILRNTYELKALDQAQARQAIIIPAQKASDALLGFASPNFDYSEDLLDEILNYLSKEGTRPIETFLLQIICQRIEDWVLQQHRKGIKNPEVKPADIGKLDSIVRDYYINVITGQDAEGKARFSTHEQLLARYLIESNLIDKVHHTRISLDKALVEQSGFDEQLLDKLINARIIRQEPNTVSGSSYELSHDTLIDPVLHAERQIGKLETQIEAYYAKHVLENQQELIEQYFLNDEGQGIKQEGGISSNTELHHSLAEASIIRVLPNNEGSIIGYELYPMFLPPALKQRTARREAQLKKERKKRQGANRLAILAVILAIIALVATVNAYKNSKVAQQAREDALKSRDTALVAMEIAEDSAQSARDARRDALAQRQLAINEKEIADSLGEVARTQKDFAILARQTAEEQKKIADSLREETYMLFIDAELGRDTAKIRLKEIESQNRLLQVQPFLTRSRDILNTNPTAALRIAEYAYKLQKIDSTQNLLYKILGNSQNQFYKFDIYADAYSSSSTFSPSGKYILTWGRDSMVKLWNTHSGKEVRAFNTHTEEVSSAMFSPDEVHILTCNNDKTVKLWSVKNGQMISTFRPDISSDRLSAFIRPIQFSPNGKYILSYDTDDNIAKLWDMTSRQQIRTIQLKYRRGSRSLDILEFSPNSEYILIGNYYKRGKYVLKLLDTHSGRLVQMFDSPRRTLLTFSPNGEYVLIANNDGTLKLFDIQNGQTFHTFKIHQGSILRNFRPLVITFSPDGRYIIALFRDFRSLFPQAKLWEIESGRELHTFQWQNESIQIINFSPDGQYIGLTLNDGTIKLLTVQNGQELHTFKGNIGNIRSLAFSPDGQYIMANGQRKRYQTSSFNDARSKNTYTYSGCINIWSLYPSPLRQQIIDSYQTGKPFSEVKDLIEQYLASGEVAPLTEEEKEQYGIK